MIKRSISELLYRAPDGVIHLHSPSGPVRLVATTTGQLPQTPTVTSLPPAPEPQSPFTLSPTAADSELGRRQVTVNERYRFIVPTSSPGTGKILAASALVSEMLASAVSQSASVQSSPSTPPAVSQVSGLLLHSDCSQSQDGRL